MRRTRADPLTRTARQNAGCGQQQHDAELVRVLVEDGEPVARGVALRHQRPEAAPDEEPSGQRERVEEAVQSAQVPDLADEHHEQQRDEDELDERGAADGRVAGPGDAQEGPDAEGTEEQHRHQVRLGRADHRTTQEPDRDVQAGQEQDQHGGHRSRQQTLREQDDEQEHVQCQRGPAPQRDDGRDPEGRPDEDQRIVPPRREHSREDDARKHQQHEGREAAGLRGRQRRHRARRPDRRPSPQPPLLLRSEVGPHAASSAAVPTTNGADEPGPSAGPPRTNRSSSASTTSAACVART